MDELGQDVKRRRRFKTKEHGEKRTAEPIADEPPGSRPRLDDDDNFDELMMIGDIQIYSIVKKDVAFDVEVAVTEEQEEDALKDPIIQQWLLDQYPQDKLTEGMNQEMERTKEFDVFDLASASSVSQEELEGAMDFTWAHR